MKNKTNKKNRIRDALSRIYDEHPPHFREYLRRHQQDPKSRVFAPLAEAYRKMGRLEDAVDVCVKGLEHHPDFHGGRVALARCYMDKKMFVEAREQLEMVVDKVPENLLAQRLLGDVHVELNDQIAARHAYQNAIALAPDDVGIAEKLHALENGQGAKPSQGQEERIEGSGPLLENPVFTDEKLEIRSEESGSLWSNEASEEASASEKEPQQEARPHWDGRGADGESVIESVLGQRVKLPPPEGEKRDRLPFSDQEAQFGIAHVLGFDNDDEGNEPFKVEHIGEVFTDEKRDREITTETIGDLYFSQGQYDRSLRIFERIGGDCPSGELEKKIGACRKKLGVNEEVFKRRKKIELLRGVLDRIQQNSAAERVLPQGGNA